ncbi:hypothetical protein ACFWXO_41885 [Kitasatospora sp. NPDC059088]|uniref:hypothetical protein n=1 Tax=Kitasatospora sp. NPDC059088 TaxID=3346722 RepID=UPI0036791EE1
MPPALNRAALRRDLDRLCAAVVNDADPDRLTGFLEACDEGAARIFGCLLYAIGRVTDATSWWRFAAGAGDDLAVHCLAVHYAACGDDWEASFWRSLARDAGVVDEQKLPDTVEADCAGTRVLAHHGPVRELTQDIGSAMRTAGTAPAGGDTAAEAATGVAARSVRGSRPLRKGNRRALAAARRR